MKILTAAQMAEVDRLSAEIYAIPSILLMENAGRSVVDELERAVPGLKKKRILILCGKGNNGGDGFVVARHLFMRGAVPEIYLLADPSALKGDALTNWNIVSSLGIHFKVMSAPSDARSQLRFLEYPDIIVDAIFGVGLAKPIGPDFSAVVEWINKAAAKAFVVSVDIPSGLAADSSRIQGPVVDARLTVTFTAPKPALVLHPACERAGRIVVAPIGSPSSLLENSEHKMDLIDRTQIRKALEPRPKDSHKGTFGHVFVVAGSRGKSGAALMTGLAALRSGAGLVTLWLPDSLQRDVVGKIPELMTEFLPATSTGSSSAAGIDKIIASLDQAQVIVLGPGMTTQESTQKLVREIVRRSPVPIVLDADGINAFSSNRHTMFNELGQSITITPHPGEMARLMDKSISEVQKNRVAVACAFSEERRCFTILKGHQTIIASPEGHVYINSTGNPGMATGGSGDILAGMVGRFVAGWQRKYHGADLSALANYLSAAVYLHGLAGDLAAEEKGVESLIATDLLPHLPEAFKRSAKI
jgi:ADP-dependent NAD(P)H-hydrate dehydratase / NAD(P)H-hydrate epimerase